MGMVMVVVMVNRKPGYLSQGIPRLLVGKVHKPRYLSLNQGTYMLCMYLHLYVYEYLYLYVYLYLYLLLPLLLSPVSCLTVSLSHWPHWSHWSQLG